MGLGGWRGRFLSRVVPPVVECDLEYLAGVVKGDGTLYYNKKAREYVVEIYERDYAYVEILVEMLRSCGYNAHVKSYGAYFRVRVNSALLYNALSSLIPALLESPTVSFVRGLLDSDGTFYYDRGLPVVELANRDAAVVQAASRLLHSLGIRHWAGLKGRKKPIYKVVVRGGNALRLLEVVKPLHPVKFSR